MSYNTNAKVNPFYIQDGDDEEDPWDDDDESDEDYDDEQVMLIGSGSGGIKNRMYNNNSNTNNNNDSTTAVSNNNNNNNNNTNANSSFRGNYHDGRYELQNSHRQHRPQLWKYGILFCTLLAVVVFGSSSSTLSKENDPESSNYKSLSIPNANDLDVDVGVGVGDDQNNNTNNRYRIVVLGERHSGTAWMSDRLRECFPHADVSTNLQRMGYFFQDDEETARSKEEALGTTTNSMGNADDDNNSNTDTIVVHVTLNVYDWLEQMRLSPEYAPDHVGTHQQLNHSVPLGWKEFLTKPWTTERPSTDLLLANKTGPVCQMGFSYNEVVSCAEPAEARLGIGDPMYELKPTAGTGTENNDDHGDDSDGDPFESILQLRTAKLKNHHAVLQSWTSVKAMIQVSYEHTAQDFKTKLLHEIVAVTGWNNGRAGETSTTACSGNVLPPSLDSSHEMTLEFVNYVTDNADWDTETSVASYVPWTEPEITAKGIRPATATTTATSTSTSTSTSTPNTEANTDTDNEDTTSVDGEEANNNMPAANNDSDSDSDNAQEENEHETPASSDQIISPPAPNESSVKNPVTNTEDEQPKEDQKTKDNGSNEESYESASSAEQNSSSGGSSTSTSNSTSEQKTIVMDKESHPEPSDSETKSESPETTGEVVSKTGSEDESSKGDEIAKEEEAASSAEDSPTASETNASDEQQEDGKEESDTDLAGKEETSDTEKEAPPSDDNNTKPSEESLTVEETKEANNKKDEEKPPPESSTPNEEEEGTSAENDRTVSDNNEQEKATEGDDVKRSADEEKNDMEADSSAD